MSDTLRYLFSEFGNWAIPLIISSIVLVAYLKKIKVYEVFIEGAKEGFQVGVRIIPYLVAVLVAIGMFRASGALDLFTRGLSPIFQFFGFPRKPCPWRSFVHFPGVVPWAS